MKSFSVEVTYLSLDPDFMCINDSTPEFYAGARGLTTCVSQVMLANCDDVPIHPTFLARTWALMIAVRLTTWAQCCRTHNLCVSLNLSDS